MTLSPQIEAMVCDVNNRWQRRKSIVYCGSRLIDIGFTKPTYDSYGFRFRYSHARKLIKIAKDRRITDPKYQNILPETFLPLYEITFLSDRTWEQALKEDPPIIHPRCCDNDIKVYRFRHQAAMNAQNKDKEIKHIFYEPPGLEEEAFNNLREYAVSLGFIYGDDKEKTKRYFLHR